MRFSSKFTNSISYLLSSY